MKASGLIRPLDTLGRVVIPVEYRRSLEIEPQDMLEIGIENKTIYLRKFAKGCAFCGSTGNLAYFKEKSICKRCLKELVELSN